MFSGDIRKWIRALTRFAIGAFAAIGLILVVVMLTPVTSIYARWLAGPWTDPEGPVLIVLGGASMEEDIIGENTYWRAVYALRAYKKSHFPLVILTGAQAAENIRDFLTFQGVPSNAIRLETRATTTRENALYVREMLSNVPGRKILMTSDYHMFRAKRVFARAGIDVIPRPIPDAIKQGANWQGRWPAFVDEIVESLKIGYYAARGWI
jgi:uncharacterized SAM-binding protein YcdF (DUF218 family)